MTNDSPGDFREQLEEWCITQTTWPVSWARLTDEAVRLHEQAVERLKYASRTRPEYDLRCDDCGAPHNHDTSIPSDIWNQIADPASVLCLLCIDARLEKAGLETDQAEFYFFGKALRSKLYDESHGDIARLAEELEQVKRERDTR